MLKLAHIINPVVVAPKSDLYHAQPITFEALRTARSFASPAIQITPYTAQYPEDHAIIPEGFHPTPDLQRSVLDTGTFQTNRKLPLLSDILDNLYHAAPDADYLIYSNVDIAPMPYFYSFINWAVKGGYDAFIINRRTLPKLDCGPEKLPWLYAQLGEWHPGHDVFVFRRDAYPNYRLGFTCIGAEFVAKTLAVNMICNAKNFIEFGGLHVTFHLGDDRRWSNRDHMEYNLHNKKIFIGVCEHYDVFRGGPRHPFIEQTILHYDPRRPVSAKSFFKRKIRGAGKRLSRFLKGGKR